MTIIQIPTNHYEQFDADYTQEVPAENYGGWKKRLLPLNLRTTAVVVMHALDCGTEEQYPGWFRAVEYIPRAERIGREVFPPLLDAIRRSGMKLYHVTGSGDYFHGYPGYRQAATLAERLEPTGGRQTEVESARGWLTEDAVYRELSQFRLNGSYPGLHNREDMDRGFARVDFAREAMPQGEEGVAENSRQLLALCRNDKINHLIYIGFAINWCLLYSPGGMVDMSRSGLICSAIRQAVTAVENKESARSELAKELALWRVAIAYGYVYDADDIRQGLRNISL